MTQHRIDFGQYALGNWGALWCPVQDDQLDQMIQLLDTIAKMTEDKSVPQELPKAGLCKYAYVIRSDLGNAKSLLAIECKGWFGRPCYNTRARRA